jgi:hypothetical protein
MKRTPSTARRSRAGSTPLLPMHPPMQACHACLFCSQGGWRWWGWVPGGWGHAERGCVCWGFHEIWAWQGLCDQIMVNPLEFDPPTMPTTHKISPLGLIVGGSMWGSCCSRLRGDLAKAWVFGGGVRACICLTSTPCPLTARHQLDML